MSGLASQNNAKREGLYLPVCLFVCLFNLEGEVQRHLASRSRSMQDALPPREGSTLEVNPLRISTRTLLPARSVRNTWSKANPQTSSFSIGSVPQLDMNPGCLHVRWKRTTALTLRGKQVCSPAAQQVRKGASSTIFDWESFVLSPPTPAGGTHRDRDAA